LLEKTNNNRPLNRFNKKCQVNINYGRGVLLPGAINQAPRNQRLDHPEQAAGLRNLLVI